MFSNDRKLHIKCIRKNIKEKKMMGAIMAPMIVLVLSFDEDVVDLCFQFSI